MKLKLPTALVVATFTLAGCGQMNNNKPSLCPDDYFCSTDAARAFNCTDLSPDPFQSDLGTCFPLSDEQLVTRSGHLTLAGTARIVEHDGALLLLAPGGVVHRLEGDSADLMRALLFFLTAPRTRDEVFRYLEALSGGAVEHPQAVDDALALLSSSGAVAEPREPTPSSGRVVLCISGAIAAAHAPELASRLLHAGFELRVALTRDARRFVSPFALEAITQQRAHSSLFQREVPHIALAEWAQLVLVCPATATTLSRIAAGDCSDLVAAIAVSSRAPKLIVPSMNPAMLESPQVQRNLHQLRDDGCWITLGGPGEEMAHAPGARIPVSGGMPAHDAVVDLVRLVLSDGKTKSE